MGQEALSIGADTFQFFTRNPRGGKAKDIDSDDAQALVKLMEKEHFAHIVAHAPYTLNPCSATEKTRDFAGIVMADDLKRMEFTPHQYYNFHPGSHTGQGIEKGIELISKLLNNILKQSQTTIVLLETMAGKGSEVGSRFQELAAIINKVKLQDKLGVCLDTCHVFDAGYDIVNDLDGVLTEFDKFIGLDKLKAIHLNDSKNTMASHKDRHACIGEGNIGFRALQAVTQHPKLNKLPFILETPNELQGYANEITMLKQH
jgi:deoxyribonuclease-4